MQEQWGTGLNNKQANKQTNRRNKNKQKTKRKKTYSATKQTTWLPTYLPTYWLTDKLTNQTTYEQINYLVKLCIRLLQKPIVPEIVEEIPASNILYSAYKSPSFNSSLSQMNTIHILRPCVLRYILILIFYPHLVIRLKYLWNFQGGNLQKMEIADSSKVFVRAVTVLCYI